jgi:MATE family multidrug resistance protein
MYLQLTTTGFHIFWCYLFIDVLNIGGGIPGAGIAIILTECLNCIGIFILISFGSIKNKAFENYTFSFSFAK